MRASRLISLILLLQSRETMTAAELARELEVSERTIYRDVLALSAAGVPVYAEQGRTGGYRLIAGYRTRLTGLTRAEAEALFLSGLRGPVADMGLADVVATARLKVLAALPPAFGDAPARTDQRFHLDVPGWFADTDPPALLTTLTQAVWRDQTVELRYRRDREVTRTAQPYGLVLKGGVWYVVARVAGDYRTYRVDRITTVRPTGSTFTRDETFDLSGHWATRTAEFLSAMLTEHVTLRLSPRGLNALRHTVEPPAARQAQAEAGPPDQNGWVVTRLPVESLDVAYTLLLGLGPEAEILDPPKLRTRMADAAERHARLYRPQR
ncbi:MAG TPA: YafY family protein [Actinomadura sp.]|jgi:predicted DNA-binding transcriptional regulator YafY|nr:YafY family protein [Actinomadura sp.]